MNRTTNLFSLGREALPLARLINPISPFYPNQKLLREREREREREMDLLIRTAPPSLLPLPLPLKPLRILCRSHSSSSPSPSSQENNKWKAELMPNARRRKKDPLWMDGGLSLGVDLGMSRTGLAIGTSIAVPRPLTVLETRGLELEIRLVELAEKEHADELIVGLPISLDGSETAQSSKVRAFVRNFAVRAADKGLRVYLQDEHGTSKDASKYMIDIGVRKSVRRVQSDAYSAVMLLERYFEVSGHEAELVLPKKVELRQKLVARTKQEEMWNDGYGSEEDFFPL
ncbi:hypothetical protein LUZ60_014422 [Juncus effusus]|nr:hypothetical protein LUZ60_014422 [Juncus effusus]